MKSFLGVARNNFVCLINRLKVKGWEKIFHAYTNHKKAEVAILISEQDRKSVV